MKCVENFESQGKKYWENFGKTLELLPRQYFDFVSAEKYKEILERYDLRNKKVVDIGAGYPAPKKLSEKELSPLASELQEILESYGAKIIAADIAENPLKLQKEIGRKSVLGNAFELPFKDGSIDGGAIILNLFNSSFKGKGDREVFINLEECKKVLREAHRILQKDAFCIVNNYGYITVTIDNLVRIIGPEKSDIITAETIKELAKESGFHNVENISLDNERIALAKKFIGESFSESLRNRLTIDIKEPCALILKK